MVITRYEILEFGKHRYWAGMLNGLADVIGEIEYTERYEDFYRLFNDELPRPEIVCEGRGLCFFTPAGLEKFAEPIKNMVEAINRHHDEGWSVSIVQINVEDPDMFVYEDEYQVVVPEKFVFQEK